VRKENVYLVGMMGAGKTTIGRKLAKAIGHAFVDLDHEIISCTGVSIPTIFEIEGEEGFRRRETQALTELAAKGGQVVATGGGVVLSPTNRAQLCASGVVVYLHAPAELLYARTQHDKNRPLLQVENPLARIATLAERRDPLYREVADIVAESGAGLNNTVNSIRQALETL
jgi:shikimate kinase